ncbi:MAG: toll/interleukin-1 receptor domain-containing protein, partial [Acidobacteria bacterium]
MAHDIFISHAQADKAVADLVCATLEQRGIRCWIAPRDIRPGADWGGAIVAAIRQSRAMVLVFSDSANASRHIPRELERAIDSGIPIVPFRIENTLPRGSLEYNLALVHWLDAVSPPLELHANRLADVIVTMLGMGEPKPDQRVGVPAV